MKIVFPLPKLITCKKTLLNDVRMYSWAKKKPVNILPSGIVPRVAMRSENYILNIVCLSHSNQPQRFANVRLSYKALGALIKQQVLIYSLTVVQFLILILIKKIHNYILFHKIISLFFLKCSMIIYKIDSRVHYFPYNIFD